MNQFKTIALLGLLSALLIAISYWAVGGVAGALLGIVIAAVTNFGSWYYSDKIALAAYRAQPVSQKQAPKLYQMVGRLCARAQLPMPAIYLVPSQTANAFATGRNPENAAVAVTQGIINLLPDDELEAVIAHELSHIRHRDTLTQAVAATVGGAIAFFAHLLSYSLWFRGFSSRDNNNVNPIGLLLMVFLAPLAATVIQMTISRTREFEADAGSARLTRNPRALARALQRLENQARQTPLEVNPAFEPLLIVNALPRNFLRNLFSTHPDLEARIQNLLKLEQELANNSSSRG